MSDDLARFAAKISGRVQGVGYRFFAVDEATARSLVGYARNLPNGDVEIVAEGPRSVLEDFLAALKIGPRMGRVESVTPTWDEPSGEFGVFGIRY